MVCRCCESGCVTDEDCPEGCADGYEETPKYDDEGNVIEGVGGCCPPGFPFDPVTRLCGGSSSPSPPIPGICCDGVCQQEVCCYCTCAKREAGTTFAYFNLDNGCEECCPPGSTWDGEVCADDETNAVVALDSHEGWSQCGDYCIPVGEECPP